MKIAVYAISKNESLFIKRFCESAKNADVILIADTGSTDDTVQIAKECGASVYNICISPWRFDIARDTALSLIPADVDVCISLDLDEVLELGWREEIERVWKSDTTRLQYKFDWGAGISFYYQKIHHRKGYHWHHPVHEYPRPDGRIAEVYAYTDKLLVSHHPDNTKSRGQYLDLLRLAVKEDPACPRNAFYFARELTFYGLWEESIGALKKYLAMPGADWVNERCYAMRLLGKAHESLNEDLYSFVWYRRACAEAPNTREPWVDLALAAYKRERWAECYSSATTALAIKDKELVYTCEPAVWTEQPHDLAAISAYNLGLFAVALTHGTIAAEMAPENQRLANNVVFYRESLDNVPAQSRGLQPA